MNLNLKHFLLVVPLLSTCYCSGINSQDGENMAKKIDFIVNDEYRVSVPVIDGPIGIHIEQDASLTLSPSGEIVIFDAFHDQKRGWRDRDLHNTQMSGVLFRVKGHSDNNPLATSDLPTELYNYPEDENSVGRLSGFEEVDLGGRQWLRVNLVGENIREMNRFVIQNPGAAYSTVVGVDYVFKVSVLVDSDFAENIEKLESRKKMLEALVTGVKITKIEQAK
jgi:hypothetical protein